MTEAPGTGGKTRLFRELLADGIVSLHLDPRVDGVQVPARLRKQEWLILNFSYNYNISDFRFDDAGVEASLSFAGQPFPCRVPWHAVFAVTDTGRTRGHVWHDDVPPEVLQAQEQAVKQSAARSRKAKGAPEPAPAELPARTPKSAPPTRRLQLVPGDQEDHGPGQEVPSPGQGVASPGQGVPSPVQGVASPGQGVPSLVQAALQPTDAVAKDALPSPRPEARGSNGNPRPGGHLRRVK